MPARKPYKVDIDVVPYLSIMAIVLKLICLILIVMVMRIAVNPDALKVVRYPELYKPPEDAGKQAATRGGTEKQITREPVYLDCYPDHLEIQPDGKIVPTLELKEHNGTFDTLIHRLETNYVHEFAIVIVRPDSAPVYRFVRRLLAKRALTVGYDVLESDVIIDWPGNIKKLAVRLEDLENKKRDMARRLALKPEDAASLTNRLPRK